MVRTRTVNLKAYGVDCKYKHGEGFQMSFYAESESGKFFTINLRIEFCLIGEIAQCLWKMIKERQDKINSITEILRGQE